MSGLYLLGVIALWVWLSWLGWKLWRRARMRVGVNRRLFGTLCLGVALLWFGVSFWYGGGQKIYYDAQVNRLCKQDGGIKVYETVKLPAEKFNQWGQINFYKPTQGENALGSEFVFKRDIQYFRKEPPTFIRHHYQVIRRTDGKVLGEAVSYGRGGGDLPGPWHPSSFTCPEVSAAGPNALLKAVFVL